METIVLNWLGPFSLLRAEQSRIPLGSNLAGPAVYFWYYSPKKFNKKTGVYVGVTHNFQERTFFHYSSLVAGDYSLINRQTHKPYPNEWYYTDSAQKSLRPEVLDVGWKEALDIDLYFALTETRKEAAYAERAFIEFYRVLRDDRPDDFFYEQDLRATKASPRPLMFLNKGPDVVRKIFGDRIVWKADNQA